MHKLTHRRTHTTTHTHTHTHTTTHTDGCLHQLALTDCGSDAHYSWLYKMSTSAPSGPGSMQQFRTVVLVASAQVCDMSHCAISTSFSLKMKTHPHTDHQDGALI